MSGSHTRQFGGTVEHEGRRSAHDSGFTLAELMAIVLIIGILVGVAVAVYVPATQSAAAIACRYNQRVLEDAVAQATADDGTAAPTGFGDLTPYVKNMDRIKLCPLDEAELEFDPATGDVSCPHPEHN